MRIAFIGLGNMGGGMAANLAKAGHEVRAFDLSEAALAKAEERGCTRTTDAASAVPIDRCRNGNHFVGRNRRIGCRYRRRQQRICHNRGRKHRAGKSVAKNR